MSNEGQQFKGTKDFSEVQQREIVAESAAKKRGVTNQSIAEKYGIKLHTLNAWKLKFMVEKNASKKAKQPVVLKEESVGDIFKRFRNDLENKVLLLTERVEEIKANLKEAEEELKEAEAALEQIPKA